MNILKPVRRCWGWNLCAEIDCYRFFFHFANYFLFWTIFSISPLSQGQKKIGKWIILIKINEKPKSTGGWGNIMYIWTSLYTCDACINSSIRLGQFNKLPIGDVNFFFCWNIEYSVCLGIAGFIELFWHKADKCLVHISWEKILVCCYL